ncbi:hypothetical protein LX32DRAFT_645786 [Colletotrichum zoysiae]|uniref:Uncharacterized protein n=1 Tax=Colletotrichum zoysiae TaxID=1216348 RepID=A0AAD9LU46_9PEZI|nr:hypothetical protein LX32DRAFT_645786 [Colletotrichum zoysiae]
MVPSPHFYTTPHKHLLTYILSLSISLRLFLSLGNRETKRNRQIPSSGTSNRPPIIILSRKVGGQDRSR